MFKKKHIIKQKNNLLKNFKAKKLKVHRFLIIITLIISISLSTLLIQNQSTNISTEHSNNRLKNSAVFQWVNAPSLSSKYFSPDSTPGSGDTTLYSFTINNSQSFNLLISAYYDIIDVDLGEASLEDFAGGSTKAGSHFFSSYMMENGTWIIAGMEYVNNGSSNEKYIVCGIGTNVTNFKWTRVGQINFTTDITIAADEFGGIRIAYIELYGLNTPFTGIKYFKSEDWGKNWTNGTIVDTTIHPYGEFRDLSMDSFNGNYTCMWSFTSNGLAQNCTIWETEEISGIWESPEELYALSGVAAFAPQVFYNHTNDNGTIFVAFTNFTDSNTYLINLQNGTNDNYKDSWSIPSYNNVPDAIPLVYCRKDYITNNFYFHDRTAEDGELGIFTGTWLENLNNKPIDVFSAESDSLFNLYSINDSYKCFTGFALSDTGSLLPGILDCKTPYNVINLTDTTTGYQTYSYVFDGNDNEGNSREAKAYSFILKIPLSLTQDIYEKIAYVDDIPANVLYSLTENRISPFESLGNNDFFRVNVTSDKSGKMTLNIKSEEAISSKTTLSDNIYRTYDPVICGDGLNYYMFYNEIEGSFMDPSLIRIMFTKSSNGGLSWEEPKTLEIIEEVEMHKYAASTDTQILLWTKEYLHISIDDGASFDKFKLPSSGKDYIIDDVSSELSCWRGYTNGTSNFIINKSSDYGYTWEIFSVLNFTGAENQTLIEAEYDPISGNYSFLLDSLEQRELLFVEINSDGSMAFISDNIFPDGMNFGGSNLYGNYYGLVDLEVKVINETTSEWYIFTSAKNYTQFSMANFDYRMPLSYKSSLNGRNFSDWDNYTAINGETIEIYNYYFSWDLIIPDTNNPCLASAIHLNPSFPFDYFPKIIEVYSNSRFVAGISENLDSHYKGEITYYGLTATGDKLSDGDYEWELNVIDRAGYKFSKFGTLTIDNTNPSLIVSSNFTTPKNPYPEDDVSVEIQISEENPDTGILYYRVPGESWTTVEMSFDNSTIPTINFTSLIPSQTSAATVYWKVLINDTCGNSIEIDNDGQLYTYGRGVFEYFKQSGALAPTLFDTWNWSYTFTSGLDHIDDVWVRMLYDGSIDTNISLTPSGDENNYYKIKVNYTTLYSNATYTFMFRSDTGQEFIMEEIFLKKPL
ncbi:MAG: hypothetical protein GF317_17010, partial [Candidatus Lokiarchaeota archaeon]|nr:hypothetical protein [Candidatus Lokiarchaeota archaeon]MBD3201219.1 hypothetical protein [Candidatus Lokiarchaeota archaeon]